MKVVGKNVFLFSLQTSLVFPNSSLFCFTLHGAFFDSENSFAIRTSVNYVMPFFTHAKWGTSQGPKTEIRKKQNLKNIHIKTEFG